jgi:hypothetical protein
MPELGPDHHTAQLYGKDFAAQLARLVAPGEEDGVAEVIAEAARLDDRLLGEFLDRFAVRVRRSSAGLTAAELHDLLQTVRSADK